MGSKLKWTQTKKWATDPCEPTFWGVQNSTPILLFFLFLGPGGIAHQPIFGHTPKNSNSSHIGVPHSGINSRIVLLQNLYPSAIFYLQMAVVFIQSILIISTTLYDGSTAAHIIKTHLPFSIYKYVRPNNVPPYIFVNTNLTQSVLIIST